MHIHAYIRIQIQIHVHLHVHVHMVAPDPPSPAPRYHPIRSSGYLGLGLGFTVGYRSLYSEPPLALKPIKSGDGLYPEDLTPVVLRVCAVNAGIIEPKLGCARGSRRWFCIQDVRIAGRA